MFELVADFGELIGGGPLGGGRKIIVVEFVFTI